MRIFKFCTVLLVTFFVCNNILAHGIWLEKRRGNLEIILGDGADDDAYNAQHLKQAQAFDANGSKIKVAIQKLEDHARLKPENEAAIIVATYDGDYFTQKKDKTWVAQPKSAVADALQSLKPYAYSFAVLQSFSNFPSNLDGVKLAIIPQSDPTQLKVGQMLKVQVLVDGKPTANIKIAEDYRNMENLERFTTDQNGMAQIPIRNTGLNVIAATYFQELKNDKDADKNAMRTTLSFVPAK